MNTKLMGRTLFQSFCMIIMISLSLAACSGKKTKGEGETVDTGVVDQEDVRSGRADSDSGNAMGMQTVLFPFDSFELTGQANSVLKNNSEILKANPSVNVQVEGHCDERGGIQYNLALGEKRANAVKKKLQALGIAASRIETISYGKEKPVALGHTESDHDQNRRGNFVITAK